MTGERLHWHRVAAHLHLPVAELRDRITFSEFLDWIAFLDWVEETPSKLDLYLAALTAEVRRVWVKSPKGIKSKDFLLRRSPGSDPKVQKSKSTWASVLGIKLKKKTE
jgi:hypothetical protein